MHTSFGSGTTCSSSIGTISVEAVVVQGPAQVATAAIEKADAAAIGEAIYFYFKNIGTSNKGHVGTHTAAATLANKTKIGLVLNTHSNLDMVDILL